MQVADREVVLRVGPPGDAPSFTNEITALSLAADADVPVPEMLGHNGFTGVIFDGGSFDDVIFSGGTVSFNAAEFSGGAVSFYRAEFSGCMV